MEVDPLFWRVYLLGGILLFIVVLGILFVLVLTYLQQKKMADRTLILEKSMKNSAYQSIANAEMVLWQTAIELPDIIDEFYNKQLKLDKETQKSIMIGLAFYENIFYQYEQGFYPAEMWVNWEKTIKTMVCTPKYMEAWKFMRPYYYAPFAQLVDSAIKEKENG